MPNSKGTKRIRHNFVTERMAIYSKVMNTKRPKPANRVDKMLKGTALIRATNFFASEDKFKSWYYVLSTMLLLACLFASTTIDTLIIIKIALAITTGLVMSRMFVLYHDYHHDAILTRSVASKCIMTAFGLFALAPVTIWKESHDHHHNHNSKFTNVVIGSFPLMTRKDFLNASKSQRFRYLAFRHPLTILFAYLPIFLISFCLYPFFETPRKHIDCLVAFLIHATFLYCLFIVGGWEMLTITGLIPFTVVCMIGAYIFYAQHNCAGVTFVLNEDWDYTNAALHSSTYIKMNPVMRWITANVGFHHISPCQLEDSILQTAGGYEKYERISVSD